MQNIIHMIWIIYVLCS